MRGLSLGLGFNRPTGGFNAAAYGNLYFQGGEIDGTRFYSSTGDEKRDLQPRYVRQLNGSTQAGIVQDNTALDITDNLTVIVRAKNDAATPASDEYFIGKYDTASNQREWAMAFEGGTGALGIYFGSAGGTFGGNYQTTATFDMSVPRTYAFNFNGGTVTTNVEGSTEAGSFVSGSAPSAINNEAANPSIGSILSNGSVALPTDGVIYEVIIINANLTESQINDIHLVISGQSTKTIQEVLYTPFGDDVRAHYKLDENVGDVFYDSSGNENHGNWQNSPTIATTSELVSNYPNSVGYSKYMYFDGSDDYVELDSNVTIDVSSNFQIDFVYSVGDLEVNRGIIGTTSQIGFWQNSGDTFIVHDGTTQFSSSISPALKAGVGYNLSIRGDGSNVKLFDTSSGSDVELASISISGMIDFNVSAIGRARNVRYAKGVIADISINPDGAGVAHSYQGYGNTDADWADQTGSNNGTVSGSPANIYAPRDEAATTNDVLGETLRNAGAAKPYALIEGSNCIDLDGSTQSLEAGTVDTSSWTTFYTEGYFKADSVSSFQRIFSLRGVDALRIVNNSGSFQFTMDLVTISFPSAITIGEYYRYVCEWDGSTMTSTLYDSNDNVLSTGTASKTSFDFSSTAADMAWGKTAGATTSYFDGELFGLKVGQASDNLICDAPVCEGAGDFCFDISGNNTTLSLEGSPTWATQDIYHYNLTTGFNNYMRFDGSSDYIAVAGMTASDDYFGSCTIEATVYITDTVSTQALWALGFSGYRIFLSSNTWRLNSTVDTGVTINEGLQTVAVDFNSSGEATELRINGVTEWTGTAAAGSGDDTVFHIGARESSGALGLYFAGIIYDFSLSGSSVKNFSFNGYGNTDADWEDQTSTNDGVVNGSPEAFRIPKLTGAETDMFGETLRNVAIVGHNDAESTFDFENIVDGATIPETAFTSSMTVDMSAIGFDEDISSDDNIFYRDNGTLSNDRFLIYAEDLTGADLTAVLEYTNSGGK